ncbi:MAG TPA: hypothetical protein PLB25_20425 [Rhodoferax sp.]|nr:hypothetical protein [Rhodoferax sp.]
MELLDSQWQYPSMPWHREPSHGRNILKKIGLCLRGNHAIISVRSCSAGNWKTPLWMGLAILCSHGKGFVSRRFWFNKEGCWQASGRLAQCSGLYVKFA